MSDSEEFKTAILMTAGVARTETLPQPTMSLRWRMTDEGRRLQQCFVIEWWEEASYGFRHEWHDIPQFYGAGK